MEIKTEWKQGAKNSDFLLWNKTCIEYSGGFILRPKDIVEVFGKLLMYRTNSDPNTTHYQNLIY